jgi:hypothetical protein
VMPRDGGVLKRLTVLGFAAAALLVPASSASAKPVWLWACHSPSGAGLGPAAGNPSGSPAFSSFSSAANTPPGSSSVVGFGDGCAAGQSQGGGLTLGLKDAPAGMDKAQLMMRVPENTLLQQVELQRTTHGFGVTGSTTPIKYVAATSSRGAFETLTLDQPNLTFDETFTLPPTTDDSGDVVTLTLDCDQAPSCASSPNGPTSVDFQRAGLQVDDSASPYAAIGGWTNPAANTLNLDVEATDKGVGLTKAEASLDGVVVASQGFGGTECTELTPDDTEVDLPIDEQCPTGGSVTLKVDTTGVADGDHTLSVAVYDAAGNPPFVKTDTISVLNHYNPGPSSASLTIGTSGVTQANGSAAPTNGTAGGVAGATSSSCASPKLSMFLSQKPLRVSHRIPVLKSGKRYRFNGRLTCVINGKRKSAPKRTRIDLQNVVGRHTLVKSGTSVRDKGSITILLAYKSSRTLVFRFTNVDGRHSQVKIKILVSKAKTKKK